MKVTMRICSVKRRTLGFVVDNNMSITRGQAVKLARRGKLEGVVAKNVEGHWYISTVPSYDGRTLYELPISVR